MEDNVLVFENDDEFTQFCLEDNPTAYHDDMTGLDGFDYKFTDWYNDAVKEGKLFRILDPASKVKKHRCVNKGIITKPVENLEF